MLNLHEWAQSPTRIPKYLQTISSHNKNSRGFCYRAHQRELLSFVWTRNTVRSVSSKVSGSLISAIFQTLPSARLMKVAQMYPMPAYSRQKNLTTDPTFHLWDIKADLFLLFIWHPVSSFAMEPEVVFNAEWEFVKKHFVKPSKWTVWIFRKKIFDGFSKSCCSSVLPEKHLTWEWWCHHQPTALSVVVGALFAPLKSTIRLHENSDYKLRFFTDSD